MSTASEAARNAAVTAATLAPVAETVAAALARTSAIAGDLVARTTEVVPRWCRPPQAAGGRCPTVSPRRSRRLPG